MEKEKSAGAVLYRQDRERLYLLLHYEGGHWDFPKGHIEAGESEKDTAKREVKEEAGIGKIEILPVFRESIHYFYKFEGKAFSKEVVFFIARTEEKEVKISFEHIGFEWLAYREALERLTFKNSKSILEKAEKFLNESKSLKDFF